MRKLSYIGMVMITLAMGCREPFAGFDYVGNGSKMVVEAIVTDTGAFSYVRLSYSEPIQGGEEPDYRYEDHARVLIIDDLGAEYVFDNTDSGFYANPGFRPGFDRSYRLAIQLGENEFMSDWQRLEFDQVDPMVLSYRPDTRQVLNDLGNPVDENVITISEMVTRKEQDLRYFWQFKHFYLFDAYGQPDIASYLPDAERFCYVQDLEVLELMIHEDRVGFGAIGPVYELDINVIPFSRKMVYDYALQVIRYNVSEEVYQYLDRVKSQIDNNGGVFDSAPSEIESNIRRTAGELDVLGFFGVFNVTSDYLFFNQSELPFQPLSFPTTDDHCARAPEGIDSINFSCWNCKAVLSDFISVDKPLWWR